MNFARRVLAGIVGLLVLVLASVPTIGGAAIAAFGMLVASAVAHRRRRVLTRGSAWVGATATAMLAVALGLGWKLSNMPAGSFEKFRQVSDSVSAAQKGEPPPAWLEKLAPGAAERMKGRANSPTNSIVKSEPGKVLFFGLGAVTMVIMFGSVAGTAGWGAALLLAFAFTGRWIPSRAPPASG